ncbi:uncharacterized protein PAC_19142 [Phialocephala subalpina]|uniref:F-box domain-containing protein n=1 Tax=Phialocephala subalpina TaxID=576137 RepID=A0A1L7XW08_9HELO|nr:uncharacterized protein PAC_19142 [Phialocephala subalpina]
MPALPKQHRRKTVPVIKLDSEHVFKGVLEALGFEPLSSPFNTNNSAHTNMTNMTTMNPTPSSNPSSRKLSILDLPSETQKDILKYASSTDLIALSLVCKQFRDLAAEKLYRTFHIVFPDDDDPLNDSPIDGLAGGLDTFVTSDYDYAQYLREITLETLSGGDKGERAYRHYLYDVSCGKFMNTLLLLTLRKARALETFKWDIRVELSRPVFKALHQIQSIQHLQLRMQSGPSIYQAPPALTSQPATASEAGIAVNILQHEPITVYFPPSSPTSESNSPNTFSLGSKISSTAHQKANSGLLPGVKTPPLTLSGFRNLKTLSILDMDTLDYIDELKVCVQNCSPTLSNLRLSFSESLANKSRKPPPDVHSDDDSEQEDEFGLGGMPPPGLPANPVAPTSSFSGPSKVLSAQQEKKKQEAVLGRIFGLDSKAVKLKAIASEPAKATKSDEDPKRKFIRSLAPVAAKLMAHIKPGSEASIEGKETLAMIEKAAKLYIESIDKGKEKISEAASDGSSTAKATPASSIASVNDGDDVVMSGGADSEEPGLFDDPETRKKRTGEAEPGLPNPDDIDVEEPEGKELAIEFEAPGPEVQPDDNAGDLLPIDETEKADQPPAAPMDSINWANKLHILDHHLAIRNSHQLIEKQGEVLRKQMEAFKLKLQSGTLQDIDYKTIAEAEAEFQRVAKQVEDLSREMQQVTDHIDELQNSAALEEARMTEYIRDTRGLTLTSLSIYLIPIRASVLSRAIDIHVLQSITLLNVGPQIQFWNVLARENKFHPLPLQKIHTDNVTLPLLAFIAQLDLLTELFMLERTAKARVESTAAKTTVTIDQIRKVILKKHVSTLKVLMIRNDAGSEWDLDVKTVLLLCHQGKKLEELACSFGIRTMHALLQSMPSLESLRALHTFQFRVDDTCVWVMREFRKFTVDIVSHNPDMKLEYLALDTSVERLARRKYPRAKKVTSKGKGKAKELDLVSAKALAELALGNSGPSVGWGDSTNAYFDLAESSDEEDGLGKSGLRIETVEGVRFCDVTGVRIFEKEIIAGRL